MISIADIHNYMLNEWHELWCHTAHVDCRYCKKASACIIQYDAIFSILATGEYH